MMRVSSPFSARAIEENRYDIPKVLIDAWVRTMRQDPISEATACRHEETLRRLQGQSALVGLIVFAAFALVMGINIRTRFDFYNILMIPFIFGAIACLMVAMDRLIGMSDRTRAFEIYRDGFGWNIKELAKLLGVTRETLKSTNLMERATVVLDAKAVRFVTVEHSLKIGLGRRLKRQDWKFDPSWNEARTNFSQSYDMLERFELVEPVEKKGDEWKPYITRAEAKLQADEESLGA